MSKTQEYDVMREHEGDKFYRLGDVRSLSSADAKVLVGLGVLAERDPSKPRTPDMNDISPDDREKFERWIEGAFSLRSKEMKDEITKLSEELNEARTNTESEIAALDQSVRDRKMQVETDLANLDQDVIRARESAAAKIAEAEAGANAKAEQGAEDKAEPAPANKADKPVKNKAE